MRRGKKGETELDHGSTRLNGELSDLNELNKAGLEKKAAWIRRRKTRKGWIKTRRG